MPDDRDDLPAHLRALLGGDGEVLEGVQKVLGRSVEQLGTGRLGRAFKLGKLAASGGTKLALSKAKGPFVGSGWSRQGSTFRGNGGMEQVARVVHKA